jgi:peptide/nickel transport system substrate-binding protein
LVLVASLALVSCGGSQPASDSALARGRTVVLAAEAIDDVLPDRTDLDFLAFDRLARRNSQGELEGLLAESWEVSEDYLEWTVHLRQDARWHDGVPVTARDVNFTFDLLDDPDREQVGFDTEVLDEFTLRIRPPHASRFLDDIVFYPRHLLEGLDPEDFWSWDFWLAPVGNGPYRFVRYVENTLMEFEANPDYYGPKPDIERVILKFVGDAGLTELLAGNVDATAGEVAQIPLVERDSRFRVHREVTAAARAIFWQMDNPLFADSNVRRALTLAIDRPALARLLYLPPEAPITDGPLTHRQLLRGDYPEPLSYDPQEARRLLEAAGWKDSDGNGIRERDTVPFRFTATVWRGHGIPQLAVQVQSDLQGVGIRMEIMVVEEQVAFERLFNGDFEAIMMIEQPGVSAHAREFGRENRIGYSNSAGFELIDQMLATAVPNELDRLHSDLAALFKTDPPVTRLLPWDWTTFAHRRLEGPMTPWGMRVDAAGTFLAEMRTSATREEQE